MSNNSHITLVQLEQALNNFQNNMIDEKGEMSYTKEWLTIFDTLLEKLIQSRALADTANKAACTEIEWNSVLANLAKPA